MTLAELEAAWTEAGCPPDTIHFDAAGPQQILWDDDREWYREGRLRRESLDSDVWILTLLEYDQIKVLATLATPLDLPSALARVKSWLDGAGPRGGGT